MSRKIPDHYMLYDTTYGHQIPAEQYFVIKFDFIPSKYTDIRVNYDPKVVKKIEELGFIEVAKIFSKNRRDDSSQILYENFKKEFLIIVNNNLDNVKDNLVQVEIYYNLQIGKEYLKELLDTFKKFEKQKKKASIKLVKSDMGHLDTEDYDLYSPPMDLELNYGKDFVKVHNTVVSRLNENNGKGIILLHGDPGTGKTSYIKYLTSLIKEKDILFIPPSMAEMLSEPSIIPFLMEYKNSILIIEDAERVIGDRENNGSPAGVSNILNLTDGILGDCLSIQIVATFNMKREKIDQALLRKGRLIAEYKFEKLSLPDTEKLLKKLNKNISVFEGMCLADIYNIDVEVFKSNKINKIGF
jgi:SpoVK/Ycf46/Vps4 family AAA+-type ATPase